MLDITFWSGALSSFALVWELMHNTSLKLFISYLLTFSTGFFFHSKLFVLKCLYRTLSLLILYCCCFFWRILNLLTISLVYWYILNFSFDKWGITPRSVARNISYTCTDFLWRILTKSGYISHHFFPFDIHVFSVNFTKDSRVKVVLFSVIHV